MSAPGAAASQCPGAAICAGRPASSGCPAAPAGTATSAATTPIAVGPCRVLYLTITEVVAAWQLFVSLDSATPAVESAQASRK